VNEVDRLSKLFVDNDAIQQYLLENYNKANYESVENYNGIINRINDFIFNYSFISSIYIICENGNEIGASDKNTVIIDGDSSQSNRFLTSEIYKRARGNPIKPTLGGGIMESYYNTDANNLYDHYIISVAKDVKPIRKPNRSAVMIMNINESYFSSIYCNEKSDEHKYVVDSSGRILSSSNEKELSKQSGVLTEVDFGKDSGSITSKRGNTLIQVVYYKLPGTDWYLIDEIPLEVLSQEAAMIQKIIIIVFCLSIIVTVAISYLWLKKTTKPLEMLSEKMNDMGSGKFGITLNKIPNNEVGNLINWFNEMSLNLVKLLKRNEEILEEKINIEIEALQAQINPHFIYNTLNMIKWMASMKHADNIVESIIVLGNLLVPTYQLKNRMWTVRDETGYLGNYLKIMNWRYGNTIDCRFSIPGNLEKIMIPKFILQPVVENSIAYGLHKTSKINITIEAYEEQGNLVLLISDNGVGIDSAKLEVLNRSFESGERVEKENSSYSVGLYNVNRRIKLNFGEAYGIRLESGIGAGTKAFVVIPLDQA
jgi:sensor histidine kinase YesM